MAEGSVCGQQCRRTVLERHLVESVKSERLESGCGGIGRVCVGRDLVKDSRVVLQCRFLGRGGFVVRDEGEGGKFSRERETSCWRPNFLVLKMSMSSA